MLWYCRETWISACDQWCHYFLCVSNSAVFCIDVIHLVHCRMSIRAFHEMILNRLPKWTSPSYHGKSASEVVLPCSHVVFNVQLSDWNRNSYIGFDRELIHIDQGGSLYRTFENQTIFAVKRLSKCTISRVSGLTQTVTIFPTTPSTRGPPSRTETFFLHVDAV